MRAGCSTAELGVMMIPRLTSKSGANKSLPLRIPAALQFGRVPPIPCLDIPASTRLRDSRQPLGVMKHVNLLHRWLASLAWSCCRRVRRECAYRVTRRRTVGPYRGQGASTGLRSQAIRTAANPHRTRSSANLEVGSKPDVRAWDGREPWPYWRCSWNPEREAFYLRRT